MDLMLSDDSVRAYSDLKLAGSAIRKPSRCVHELGHPADPASAPLCGILRLCICAWNAFAQMSITKELILASAEDGAFSDAAAADQALACICSEADAAAAEPQAFHTVSGDLTAQRPCVLLV